MPAPESPSRFAPVLEVRDIDLAVALFTAGCVPDPRNFHERVHDHDRGRTYSKWNFLPMTVDGRDSTPALIKAWGNHEEFNEKNPEHRFAYLSCFAMNKKGFLAMTKDSPMVALRKGSGLALVDPKSPQAVQDDMLAAINF